MKPSAAEAAAAGLKSAKAKAAAVTKEQVGLGRLGWGRSCAGEFVVGRDAALRDENPWMGARGAVCCNCMQALGVSDPDLAYALATAPETPCCDVVWLALQVVQARLQELGPRFTLKLESLQKGTFDSKHGVLAVVV